jgi:hypothetical protein
MFKGILSSDLKLLPGLLKKQLNDSFQIKHLINAKGKLSESACHKMCLNVLASVKNSITEYYQISSKKNTPALTQALDDNEHYYKDLLICALYEKIKTLHTKVVQKNLPKKMNIDILSNKIRRYSIKPQRGIDNQAVVNFLGDCVFMYRSNLNKQPLQRILDFILDNKKAFMWLKNRIRDDAIKLPDQYWPTGKHEWLPCNLIIDVLKRSAGMEKNIIPYVVNQIDNNVVIVDWLSIHSSMRSPIQHIYFKNDNNTIDSGHTPALRDQLDGPTVTGIQTKGSEKFHAALRFAFYSSCNPREFIRKMPHIENNHLVSGKKHLSPTKLTFFTAEGVQTNNEKAINQIRHEKIRPEYKDRKALFTLFSNMSINGNDGNDVLSLASDETEYSNPDLVTNVSSKQHNSSSGV